MLLMVANWPHYNGFERMSAHGIAMSFFLYTESREFAHIVEWARANGCPEPKEPKEDDY